MTIASELLGSHSLDTKNHSVFLKVKYPPPPSLLPDGCTGAFHRQGKPLLSAHKLIRIPKETDWAYDNDYQSDNRFVLIYPI